jgi:proteasome accessory factor C
VVEDVDALASLWVDPGEGDPLVHLYVEDGAVHALYAEPFGRPPALSLAEGAVLLAALAPFEKGAGRPARAAARKLRRAIPEPLRPEADRLAAGIDVAAAPPGPWAGALREAIDRRVEATLEYRAVADAAAEERVVEPRLLFQRDGRWYLAAWNVAKQAEHLFRLDRIAAVELGTRVFGEHKGPPVSRYARRNLYFESGAEREVTLRFRGSAARLARERYGARARDGGDATVSVTLKVTPGNYLLGVVLGYGGECTIEAPADVVRQLRERVEELGRMYRP